ncbi:RnfABCDGE type electron transport complex subunit D [Paenibacillus filicis]|uniref:RnfABCDGE type electron transport complex subunit D n=1 Tax=Paenibacillus gyeongsangnamensis TaxID=3388067 RepID=A0ABT4QBL9_9BACL|nr:RnfABCDGE type electron transport complex subunit D [Paenibacillus filicis]MCZ8514283.1 RnfABCDGE type electron transport complex subunit D [Paenibacillus filicis]
MKISQWIKTPKGYVAIAMAAYAVIASIGLQNGTGVVKAVLAVGVCVAVDIICSRIVKKKLVIPDSAFITGLIISMILSTTTSWLVVSATAAISILSKYFFVYRKKPIFNPAVMGLLASVLIFGAGQSWWGAFSDLPAWSVLVLIGGYAITNRIHKYPQVFSFFGTLFMLLLLLGLFHKGDVFDALRPPFINAALYFGFFMLTDPPTSPAKVNDQIIFGIIVAAAGTVIYVCFGGLMYLFIGLMLGNAYHWLKMRSTVRMAQAG